MPQGSKPDHQGPPPGSPATEPAVSQAPCKTAPLIEEFSICLADQRGCKHALSFGNSYLCRHPEHAKFAVYGATATSGSKKVKTDNKKD